MSRPVRVPSDDELQCTLALVEQISASVLAVARVALAELAAVRRVAAGGQPYGYDPSNHPDAVQPPF